MKKTISTVSLMLLACSSVAFAGAEAEVVNSVVQAGEPIELDGHRSTAEHGGRITKYRWVEKGLLNKRAGHHHSIQQQSSTSPTATFIAPEVNETTELEFVLVTQETIFSGDSVRVIVEPRNINSRPPTEDNNTEDNSTVITFEGLEYRPITSAVTGRTWLDRNMGATQACESPEDTACYGDYYQWGRGADGHQVYRRETRGVIHSLTPYQLEHLRDVSDTFARALDSGPYGTDVYDWLYNIDNSAGIRQDYWARTDGSYICPVGYRVPTAEEFGAETDYAFFNIGYAGRRIGGSSDNRIVFTERKAYFWTNTPIEAGVNVNATAYFFYKSDGSRHSFNRGRTDGLSVRCIEDQ